LIKLLGYIDISALELASPRNQHCANCIGTLAFHSHQSISRFVCMYEYSGPSGTTTARTTSWMMSAYDCLNKKRFNSRRKVDSELAATTSVGSCDINASRMRSRLKSVADGRVVGAEVHYSWRREQPQQQQQGSLRTGGL